MIGTVGSKTCDNDDPLSVLGQTEVESVARSPSPQIPDFFHFADNRLKRGALVCSEESRHIFQDDPTWPNLPSQVHKPEEEPAARSAKA